MFKIKNPRKMRLIKPKSWRKSPVAPAAQEEEVQNTIPDTTPDNNEQGDTTPANTVEPEETTETTEEIVTPGEGDNEPEEDPKEEE